MSLQNAMISSKSNEWVTPQDFFDELNDEFGFTLDPCSTDINYKCIKHYTLEDNGLSKDWSGDVVFMNLPYGGNTGYWIKKALAESRKGSTVVCLIVSATDRSYWHDYIFPNAAQIRFIRGGLRFSDATSTAPFASAVVVFSKKIVYKNRVCFFNKSISAAKRDGEKQIPVPE